MNVEPSTGNYYPTIFFNEFWLLRDKLIPVNETVTELPLNLEVGPISMTKWQLFLQIDQSFQIHRSYGSMLEGEADELKVLLICYIIKLGLVRDSRFNYDAHIYFHEHWWFMMFFNFTLKFCWIKDNNGSQKFKKINLLN